MMQVRIFEEEDFSTIQKWLKWWYPNKDFHRGMYPDTGLILYDDITNEEIYSGFVWTSNSKMAQIGFIIRNPYYKNKQVNTKQTLETFVRYLISYAKELGFDYVITWAEHSNLKSIFREIGMLEAGDKVSEFVTKIE